MKIYSLIAERIGIIIEKIKGPRSVIDITEPRAQLESLEGNSSSGYITRVFCQEKKYLIKYSKWFVPNQIFYQYKVFCTIHGKAPENILKAMQRELIFPPLLFDWAPNTKQKIAAIEAFLDMVLADLP